MSNTSMPGTHGKYLRIDLTTGHSEFVPIAPQAMREFIGGSGLGTYLLLQEGAAKHDPLSPEAAIAFVFSPLVGSPLTTSAKFAVVSKGVLTNRLNDSLASSGFAIAGKKCGCDAIVLVGQAKEPVVVIIDDGNVQLQPAGEAWGLEIPTAEAHLAEKFGSEFKFAVIGPAGENLVRYATISHDGRHAGRGGSGAVFGSKRVKALAVRGNQRCEWFAQDELVELAKSLSKKSLGPATAKYRELGTATNLLTFNRLNALPTRNFQQGSFATAEKISPEQLSTTHEKTRTSCACCTIGCEHIYGIRKQGDDENNGKSTPGVRVEYENLFALGPLCGIDDPDVVLAASKRCNELGLDTISTGGTVAFAMECVERGWLDEPWLAFGNGQSLLDAIEQIGHRTAFGNAMAEGSRRLANKLGSHTLSIAPQVKGLEIPGYEPRALQTMALGFAVGARGADHNRSGAYEVDFSDQVDRRAVDESAVPLAIQTEDRAAIMDSAILCKFLRGALDDFYGDVAEMLHLVTGWDMTTEELQTCAKRIINAKKEFNVAAGWTPEEDTLPARMLEEKLPNDDRAELSRERLNLLIEAYNLARGWSKMGWPTVK